MLQALQKQAEPQFVNAPEERSISEWQQLYPDLWLFLEVTKEEEGEPRAGRLIAVDMEDINLVSVCQEYEQRGKITAMVRGISEEIGPTIGSIGVA